MFVDSPFLFQSSLSCWPKQHTSVGGIGSCFPKFLYSLFSNLSPGKQNEGCLFIFFLWLGTWVKIFFRPGTIQESRNYCSLWREGRALTLERRGREGEEVGEEKSRNGTAHSYSHCLWYCRHFMEALETQSPWKQVNRNQPGEGEAQRSRAGGLQHRAVPEASLMCPERLFAWQPPLSFA